MRFEKPSIAQSILHCCSSIQSRRSVLTDSAAYAKADLLVQLKDKIDKPAPFTLNPSGYKVVIARIGSDLNTMSSEMNIHGGRWTGVNSAIIKQWRIAMIFSIAREALLQETVACRRHHLCRRHVDGCDVVDHDLPNSPVKLCIGRHRDGALALSETPTALGSGCWLFTGFWLHVALCVTLGD
jgi:hypothetical protein